jgi:hypothetical protein
MSQANLIKCPNCGNEFPVEEALTHQAEERIRKEYQQKLAIQNKELSKQKELLDKEKAEFEQKKQKENELFQERLKKSIEEQKNKLKQEALQENELVIKQLQEENEKRKKENIELRQKEIALMEKEKELKEAKEQMELEMKKQFLQKQEELETEVRKKEQERNELRVKEYEKKLEDQKKLIEEMQRKVEQGSMQIQGEVQELALEGLLRATFPHDIIEEVGKGVKGADVIQTVVNSFQQICGKIIYESKRTKAFSDSWIEKLKDDQREQGAALAVIVTETLPKDMNRFGRRDGIWICTYHEIEGLIFVLREMLLREFSLRASEENKGDKMQLLYNYLTSDEFRSRVEAIVEGFSTMKIDMEKEKRAMQNIWKQREKQIEKVISNTVDMYASVKGIAGNAIAPVKALELDTTEENGELEE